MRVLLALILMLGVPSISRAAEDPCRADDTTVTCTRPAFDKLMAKIIDARADRDIAKVKLDSVTRDLADVTAALEACERRPPVVIEPPKPTALRSVLPVLVGALGAAILTTSVAIDIGPTGRVTGAVVGLAAVGTGIVLALP